MVFCVSHIGTFSSKSNYTIQVCRFPQLLLFKWWPYFEFLYYVVCSVCSTVFEKCTASIFTLTEFCSDGWSECVEDNVSVRAPLPLCTPVFGQNPTRLPIYPTHFLQFSHFTTHLRQIQSPQSWVLYVPFTCHKKPSTPHGIEIHKKIIIQTKQRWVLLHLKGYVSVS